MHCRELINIAAQLAQAGPRLIAEGSLTEAALREYWSASKARSAAWTASLRIYLQLHVATTPKIAAEGPLILAWQEARPVLEEILVSEVLARVWTCLVCLHDRQHRGGLTPLARRSFVDHLEARNRALNVLVYGRGIPAAEAVEMNALRRRCERWSDLLLGHLFDPSDSETLARKHLLEEFAFDPQRTLDFAQDLAEEGTGPAMQVLHASLRAAFAHSLSDDSPSAEQNELIAEAALACLSAQSGDCARPNWLSRMDQLITETESRIAELLA
jgi:hypothetical protein